METIPESKVNAKDGDEASTASHIPAGEAPGTASLAATLDSNYVPPQNPAEVLQTRVYELEQLVAGSYFERQASGARGRSRQIHNLSGDLRKIIDRVSIVTDDPSVNMYLRKYKELASLLNPDFMADNGNSFDTLQSLDHSTSMKQEVVLAERRAIHEAKRSFAQMDELVPYIDKAQLPELGSVLRRLNHSEETFRAQRDNAERVHETFNRFLDDYNASVLLMSQQFATMDDALRRWEKDLDDRLDVADAIE